MALAVAWAVTLLALLLPGCDVGGLMTSNGVRPTYTVFTLTGVYTLQLGRTVVDAASRPGRADPTPGGGAMLVACPLFLLGSAAFLLTPRLLSRRIRRKFGRSDLCLLPLLLAPWVLLWAAGAQGDAAHFLYGYYLLATGYTAAFVIIAWPPPVRAGAPVGSTS